MCFRSPGRAIPFHCRNGGRMDKALGEKLYWTGEELRKAQKRCARSKTTENNRLRLDAERKFDAVLEECAKSVEARQAKLL